MGTNYYLHKIPTKERKSELCQLIDSESNFSKIQNEINKTFGELEYDSDSGKYNGGIIHLGKRSAGWKFLWNPNIYKLYNSHIKWEEIEPGHKRGKIVEDPYSVQKFYELTKKSLKEFIDREEFEIYDEYGDKQDKEEFWEMALNWTTWVDHKTGEEKEAWDGKSYELWEQEQNSKYHGYNYFTDYTSFLQELGYEVDWPYTDFYSDGLRFSTNTKFS